MSYERFAYVYDELMKDAPYDKWLSFIEQQSLRNITFREKNYLDLACGTGEITVELAKHGFDVSGVDLSDEMLFNCSRKGG